LGKSVLNRRLTEEYFTLVEILKGHFGDVQGSLAVQLLEESDESLIDVIVDALEGLASRVDEGVSKAVEIESKNGT
jgi:hypothetical protein